jgi:catechol 2,3-dioxygenase-like lactoylglutathione lyase family enzyme
MTITFDTSGRIKCGTIMVPQFDAACADYQQALGLLLVETSKVHADVAASWGTPDLTGRRSALFQPSSGRASYVRLIEGALVSEYKPARSYGWISLEMSVRDVWTLHANLIAHGAFSIMGAPKLIDGFHNFIPMQVVGRSGEILYLNQVLQSTTDLDLPMAEADVDEIFITVLAAPDRQAAVDFYVDIIGFERGGTFSIIYSVINTTFGLPAETKSDISMTRVARLPGLEIDQYPDQTTRRPCAAGELPPGVGMVSYLVPDLSLIKADFIAPPQIFLGPIYQGRRAATIIGPAGEYLELIEHKEQGYKV